MLIFHMQVFLPDLTFSFTLLILLSYFPFFDSLCFFFTFSNGVILVTIVLLKRQEKKFFFIHFFFSL